MRPTGLMDPEVIVRPTKGQIDDLVGEIVKPDGDDVFGRKFIPGDNLIRLRTLLARPA